MALLKSDIESFNEQGFLKVSGILSPETLTEYKLALVNLIAARGESKGLSIDSTDLDQAFDQLCNLDRSLGGDIYDHAKEVPEFYSCIASTQMKALIQALLGKRTVQVASSQCVFRIDRPKEDKFGFGWHQDYWYNCTTQNAITAWMCLTDVEGDVGPLEAIPGSHKEILPVVVDDPDNSNGNMAGVFRLSNQTPIDDDQIVKIPMKAGDVLFFHSCLLHRSGKNRSCRSRWTIQYRYADFIDKEYTARGWSHGTVRGNVAFCNIHPELMVSE